MYYSNWQSAAGSRQLIPACAPRTVRTQCTTRAPSTQCTYSEPLTQCTPSVPPIQCNRVVHYAHNAPEYTIRTINEPECTNHTIHLNVPTKQGTPSVPLTQCNRGHQPHKALEFYTKTMYQSAPRTNARTKQHQKLNAYNAPEYVHHLNNAPKCTMYTMQQRALYRHNAIECTIRTWYPKTPRIHCTRVKHVNNAPHTMQCNSI